MPQQSPDIMGRTWTTRYRLRPTFFGVRLERLVTNSDGTSLWVRSPFAVEISGKDSR